MDSENDSNRLRTDDRAVSIDSVEEFESMIGTSNPSFVDFHAEWCGPCKQMEPVIEDVAAHTEATVLTIDVDDHPDIASRFNVRSIPTSVIVKDGVELERFVGKQPFEKLKTAIAQSE